MPSLNKKEEFLGKVLRQIKFPFDRADIKAELADHISERVDHYLELGYDQERAEQAAVSDMGDPTQIGVELNKEHSPLLGWLWKASGLLVSLVVALNIFFGAVALSTLFEGHTRIPQSAIVYQVSVDETVRLDDRVIHFSKVVYDRDGNLHIFFEHYEAKLWGLRMSFSNIGSITDNLGNEYFDGTLGGGRGLWARGSRMVEDFSPEAILLVITYDAYNRKYEVRVPLPGGDGRE